MWRRIANNKTFTEMSSIGAKMQSWGPNRDVAKSCVRLWVKHHKKISWKYYLVINNIEKRWARWIKKEYMKLMSSNSQNHSLSFSLMNQKGQNKPDICIVKQYQCNKQKLNTIQISLVVFGWLTFTPAFCWTYLEWPMMDAFSAPMHVVATRIDTTGVSAGSSLLV